MTMDKNLRINNKITISPIIYFISFTGLDLQLQYEKMASKIEILAYHSEDHQEIQRIFSEAWCLKITEKSLIQRTFTFSLKIPKWPIWQPEVFATR